MGVAASTLASSRAMTYKSQIPFSDKKIIIYSFVEYDARVKVTAHYRPSRRDHFAFSRIVPHVPL